MRGQAFAAGKPASRIAALILALGFASPALAQSAPTPQPPPTQAVPTGPLRGPAAWQQLVGNTIVAQARSGGYTEFYAPDGAVTHLDQDGKSVGKWSVEGDKVCFDFPEEDDRSCVTVEVDGTTGTFIDEDQTRDTFTIAPGNAKNF